MADQTPERDYLAEAMGIAAGTSRVIAEDKHVIALAAQQAKTVADVQTVTQILAAVMLVMGSDVDVLPIDRVHMARVLASKTQIYIKRLGDGGVLITRQVLKDAPSAVVPAAANGSGRVQ